MNAYFSATRLAQQTFLTRANTELDAYFGALVPSICLFRISRIRTENSSIFTLAPPSVVIPTLKGRRALTIGARDASAGSADQPRDEECRCRSEPAHKDGLQSAARRL